MSTPNRAESEGISIDGVHGVLYINTVLCHRFWRFDMSRSV